MDTTGKLLAAASRTENSRTPAKAASPDYLIAVGYDVATKVQDAVIDAVEDFYGPNPGEAKQFGRMITPDHTQRLVNLLQATMKGAVGATPARLVYGGKYNIESA